MCVAYLSESVRIPGPNLNWFIQLRKGKCLRKHSLHGKIAASVLLKLYTGSLVVCAHMYISRHHARETRLWLICTAVLYPQITTTVKCWLISDMFSR